MNLISCALKSQVSQAKSATRQIVATMGLLMISHIASAAADVAPEQLLDRAGQSVQQFTQLLPQLPAKEAFSLWHMHLAAKLKGQGPTAKATDASLLIRNGLKVSGLELLFSIERPNAIPAQIIKTIQSEIPAKDEAWKIAQITWNRHWNKLFPEASQQAVLDAPSANLPGKSQFAAFKKKIRLAAKGSAQQAYLRWRLALGSIFIDDNSLANAQLNDLLDSEQTTIPQDQIHMALARLLYQDKDFAEALVHYKLITPKSEYWLESLEESAWSYAQLNNNDAALSKLASLLTPILAPRIAAEPYFLSGLLNLKSCNYQNVFALHRQFKSQYEKKVKYLMAIQATTPLKETQAALQEFKANPTSWISSANIAKVLPHGFQRDQRVKESSLRGSILNREMVRARELDAFLKSQGLASSMASTISTLDSAVRQTDRTIDLQLRKLATRELSETQRLVTKMQLVEAEAIHRMQLLSEKVQSAEDRTAVIRTGNNAISFPGSSEVWLDELDHIQVDATRCPEANGGKAL